MAILLNIEMGNLHMLELCWPDNVIIILKCVNFSGALWAWKSDSRGLSSTNLSANHVVYTTIEISSRQTRTEQFVRCVIASFSKWAVICQIDRRVIPFGHTLWVMAAVPFALILHNWRTTHFGGLFRVRSMNMVILNMLLDQRAPTWPSAVYRIINPTLLR